jgi:hypothetical protein
LRVVQMVLNVEWPKSGAWKNALSQSAKKPALRVESTDMTGCQVAKDSGRNGDLVGALEHF